MHAIRVHVTVEKDGEVRITDLPCRRGERVEAVITVQNGTAGETAEQSAARRRLVEMGRASTFRSAGKYPSRDELHERD